MAARSANPGQIVGLIDQFTFSRDHAVQQGNTRVGVDDFLTFLQEYLIRHPAVVIHSSGNELKSMFNSLATLARETHAQAVAPTIRKIAAIAALRVDDTVRVTVEEALGTLELSDPDVARAARNGIDRIEKAGWTPVRTETYRGPLMRM